MSKDGKPLNKMCKINEELCGEWVEGVEPIKKEYLNDTTNYLDFLKELNKNATYGCILDKYCGRIGANEAGEDTIFKCPDDNLTKMINHGRPMSAAAG